MPRLKNSLPKLCHHKGTNQACVYHHGKPRYLGKWGSQKAKKAYSEFTLNHSAKRGMREGNIGRPFRSGAFVRCCTAGWISADWLHRSRNPFRRASGSSSTRPGGFVL